MLLEVTLLFLLGILAGTITGLTPGIHINLISTILLSSSIFLLNYFTPLSLVIFIVSMSITHTFLDFIPAIFLGAPSEDTALGILPGHKFLLKGNAYQAIILTLIGSFASIILLIIVIPLLFLFLPKIYPSVIRMMPWILFSISLILLSKTKKILISTIIFLLAGFLGITTLNLPLNQPLLPLLSGLFGTSNIILSLLTKTKIPLQKITPINISKKQLIKPLLATTIISPICSFLPGLGSSQAAILSKGIIGKINKNQFLILLGSINTLVMSTSFITLYLIEKTRTGSAVAINQLIQLTPKILLYILITILISSIISLIISIKLTKIFTKNINKLNYFYLSLLTLLIITILTGVLSGFLGILILTISTLLGITTTKLEIRKSYLMGCLILPTFLYYLPFF
jgi:putative membrane protein